VEEVITPRAKLIIINSPSNPSGLVIPPGEFEKIVRLCVDRGLWIISDECYCQFVYHPVKPFSAAQLPESLRSQILIAGSVSKTYAMTGWRLGFGLGPAEWVEAMSCLQSHSTSNPTSISQEAAIEALSGPQESVSQMLAAYRERRDWFVPQLRSLSGVKCSMPDGAFYAFPSVKGILGSGSMMTSEDLATYLLEETGVAVTPGDAFGAPGYIRLSYATSMDNLKTAIERMSAAFRKLTAEPTDWAV
ncbi:MAG: aminotransferase class I/II-fold pyridoxal phosphate-dependent enzyme, partial [Pyrinomonadaceae bacterium]